jgi:hypothetical protein
MERKREGGISRLLAEQNWALLPLNMFRRPILTALQSGITVRYFKVCFLFSSDLEAIKNGEGLKLHRSHGFQPCCIFGTTRQLASWRPSGIEVTK